MIAHTNFTLNNMVSLAKKQLEQHEQRGLESTLSIFEVARLRDLLRQENNLVDQANQRSHIGFSVN
ncbi:MAG: hypothetical protein R3277_06145 [Brumimicrobium sp.]|nr:hypothetical protein [Brumimicrobium sp.]